LPCVFSANPFVSGACISALHLTKCNDALKSLITMRPRTPDRDIRVRLQHRARRRVSSYRARFPRSTRSCSHSLNSHRS
jgi:hypothetical protein